MELREAQAEALRDFDALVHRIGPDQWDDPTPCSEWTVRDLLGHLVYEQLWAPDLLGGATIAEVGDRYDGDQLGNDPVGVWEKAAKASGKAFQGELPEQVQVSFGRIPAADYGWQMTSDLAVHAWDLAVGLGEPYRIGEELAERLLTELAPQVPQWAGAGVFDDPKPVAENATAADRLLALLGRDPALDRSAL